VKIIKNPLFWNGTKNQVSSGAENVATLRKRSNGHWQAEFAKPIKASPKPSLIGSKTIGAHKKLKLINRLPKHH
jgi:hypothetical protein